MFKASGDHGHHQIIAHVRIDHLTDNDVRFWNQLFAE